MFFEDLSFMQDLAVECHSSKKLLAVGWIDSLQRYATGRTPESFREKLHKLCLNPIRLTRGFHRCPFCPTDCPTDEFRGNGEIHVSGDDGIVYVAPSLISHYVDTHNYCPPEAFEAAVNATEINANFSGPLSDAVQQFFEDPTPQNRHALYKTFVKSRVGFRVTSGEHIITSIDQLRVPTGQRGDGSTILLVWADVDILAKHELASTFAQMDSNVIVDRAIRINSGIMIDAWLGGRFASAEIPAGDVPGLPKA